MCAQNCTGTSAIWTCALYLWQSLIRVTASLLWHVRTACSSQQETLSFHWNESRSRSQKQSCVLSSGHLCGILSLVCNVPIMTSMLWTGCGWYELCYDHQWLVALCYHRSCRSLCDHQQRVFGSKSLLASGKWIPTGNFWCKSLLKLCIPNCTL